MKKLILFLLLSCLCCCALTACGENQTESNQPENNPEPQSTEAYLTEKYSLDSDEIKIYDNSEPPQIIATITDAEDILALQNSMDFAACQKATPENEYAGEESFFIQFNDKTTIAIYNDIAYGRLGKGTPDENGGLANSDAYYYMNQELLETVLQMIEKYRL